MTTARHIEIFTAGCPACQQVVELVQDIACASCQIEVLNMNDSEVAHKAKALGISTVPAVVIDGELAGCCSGRGVDEATLRAAGLGNPLT